MKVVIVIACETILNVYGSERESRTVCGGISPPSRSPVSSGALRSLLELFHNTCRRCVCRHHVIEELDSPLAVGTYGRPVISYECVSMLTRFKLIRWFCLNSFLRLHHLPPLGFSSLSCSSLIVMESTSLPHSEH